MHYRKIGIGPEQFGETMTTTVVNPAEPIDYSSTTTPSSYACGDCGKSGVKLWRDYQAFLHHQSLRCADCAVTKEEVDISSMQLDGRYARIEMDDADVEYRRFTDQIGWLIPAVPTKENDTFWGYTSVPQDGRKWWQSLPIR